MWTDIYSKLLTVCIICILGTSFMTNIFIDDQWHVRLANFGLAGFADATHTSNSDGFIRWMAPELHDPEICGLNKPKRTAASDVYALACVALEIYTRNYTFSDTPYDNTVILKVIQGQRPIRPMDDTGRTLLATRTCRSATDVACC